jgi:long-chain acyl-CoA synthetase
MTSDYKNAYLSRPWLQFYTEGVPHNVEIPDLSIPEFFDQAAGKFSKRTALVFYGKKIKYGELRELSDRFAAALVDLGIAKGDTVALYLLNCPQYVIAYLGTLKAGAKVTPISPVYTSQELKHQLEDSEAKSLICEDILLDNVERSGVELEHVILSEISDFLPSLKKMFGQSALKKAYGKIEGNGNGAAIRSSALKFKDLLNKYPAKPPKVDIQPSKDIAALPYTGGTTGLPKAAILTHHNIVATIKQAIAFWPIFYEGKETVIAFLPFYHIYGQVVVMLNSLVQGFTLVLFTTPDMEQILTALERYQASAFFGVPTLYEYLKEYEKTSRVNWKKLKLTACGADTLHHSTKEAFERRSKTTIMEGYGMTENCSLSHSSPTNRPKSGSFGVPIPNVTAAIIDVESNEFMPVDEVGEMILTGPNVMQGYWKRPESNKADFIEIDGTSWLRTGDLVRMDEDGYFHFFDRKRDLIKFKGYSVFARHVEEVLYKHPQIKSAGVVGVPEPSVGQLIKAYVVLQGEARGKISEEEIIEFCKENMAHYKVPKIIEFRGELPRTDVGKVSRRELREEADED